MREQALARSLELGVLLEHLLRARFDLEHGCVLVEVRLVGLEVYRDRRDEHVVADGVTQELRRSTQNARDETRRVDHRVPLASLERREVAVAVAPEPLGLGEELRIRLTAVEEGHLVTPLERRLDRRAAEEPRPPQNQEPHSARSSSSNPSTSSAVL